MFNLQPPRHISTLHWAAEPNDDPSGIMTAFNTGHSRKGIITVGKDATF